MVLVLPIFHHIESIKFSKLLALKSSLKKEILLVEHIKYWNSIWDPIKFMFLVIYTESIRIFWPYMRDVIKGGSYLYQHNSYQGNNMNCFNAGLLRFVSQTRISEDYRRYKKKHHHYLDTKIVYNLYNDTSKSSTLKRKEADIN